MQSINTISSTVVSSAGEENEYEGGIETKVILVASDVVAERTETSDSYSLNCSNSSSSSSSSSNSNDFNNDSSSVEIDSSSITMDGPIISIGNLTVHNTTIVSLKGSKRGNADGIDGDGNTRTTSSNSSSSSIVSFNQEVTINHVENFIHTLNEGERYYVWYSDTETERMLLEAWKEKQQAEENLKLQITKEEQKDDAFLPTAKKLKNNCGEEVSSPPSSNNRRRFSLSKKAKSVAKYFVLKQERSSSGQYREGNIISNYYNDDHHGDRGSPATNVHRCGSKVVVTSKAA